VLDPLPRGGIGWDAWLRQDSGRNSGSGGGWEIVVFLMSVVAHLFRGVGAEVGNAEQKREGKKEHDPIVP
jgi:hypothetical protein